jgi:hypothetical protein
MNLVSFRHLAKDLAFVKHYDVRRQSRHEPRNCFYHADFFSLHKSAVSKSANICERRRSARENQMPQIKFF